MDNLSFWHIFLDAGPLRAGHCAVDRRLDSDQHDASRAETSGHTANNLGPKLLTQVTWNRCNLQCVGHLMVIEL